MKPLKVLVLGTGSSGKTTFLKNVSETPIYHFDYPDQGQKKFDDDHTDNIEFGRININDELSLQLFVTDLEYKYVPVWHRLENGLIGAIVLLDGTSPSSWNDYKEIISKMSSRKDLSMVLILTKVTRGVSAQRATDARKLLDLPSRVPIFVWNTAEPMVERRILAELCKTYLAIRSAVAG